jgi:hypothetical protein
MWIHIPYEANYATFLYDPSLSGPLPLIKANIDVNGPAYFYFNSSKTLVISSEMLRVLSKNTPKI